MAFSGPFSNDVPFWKNGPSPGCVYDFPKANRQIPGNFKQYSQWVHLNILAEITIGIGLGKVNIMSYLLEIIC